MTDAATRFSHQAALYESGDHGAAMLLPFLEEAIRRNVPTILMVDPDLDSAIDRALGEKSSSIIRLSPAAYRRPLSALQRELSLCGRLLVRGAPEVRVVAAVPHTGTGADSSGWVRFEAAVNHFFAPMPVSRICVYDLRTSPHDVVDDVMATHPSLLDRNGVPQPNPRYVEPEALLPDREAREVDPLEETKPTVELMDPSIDQARAAVENVARNVPLRRQDVSALCVAADEAITNARQHGRGTVTTRIWRGPNRVAVAVSDEGTGPASPFAGMLAGAGRQGMWLLHQLCTRVSTTREPDGFTVHLVAQANVPRRG